ncbi:hypothetical protein PVAP13_9NG358742 [Panicum virgatum]|uniref:Uncharacterized protein n=1 Tax=Panicum virgatum TaxID=38727 RepID=A0A8T0MQV4_PANVG|nr:hypothetical protein PVAP13_9NG358742 [Panicum virgatum]
MLYSIFPSSLLSLSLPLCHLLPRAPPPLLSPISPAHGGAPSPTASLHPRLFPLPLPGASAPAGRSDGEDATMAVEAVEAGERQALVPSRVTRPRRVSRSCTPAGSARANAAARRGALGPSSPGWRASGPTSPGRRASGPTSPGPPSPAGGGGAGPRGCGWPSGRAGRAGAGKAAAGGPSACASAPPPPSPGAAPLLSAGACYCSIESHRSSGGRDGDSGAAPAMALKRGTGKAAAGSGSSATIRRRPLPAARAPPLLPPVRRGAAPPLLPLLSSPLSVMAAAP